MRQEESALPRNMTERGKTTAGGSILVVDDDAAFVKALAIYLEDMGFNVTTATCGLRGVIESQRRPIDVVLVDVNLPDVDGLEVLSRIQMLHPLVSCILTSSDDSLETIRESAARGHCIFMAKPLSPKKLLETIRHLISTKWAPTPLVAK